MKLRAAPKRAFSFPSSGRSMDTAPRVLSVHATGAGPTARRGAYLLAALLGSASLDLARAESDRPARSGNEAQTAVTAGAATGAAAEPPAPAAARSAETRSGGNRLLLSAPLPSPAAAAPPVPPDTKPAAPDPAHKVHTETLGEVNVQGHRDALSDQDRRLQRLKDSLPDLDTVGTKPTESDVEHLVHKIGEYAQNHKDVNKLSDDSKDFLQRLQQQSLDREHSSAAWTPPSRDSADYKDPLCQTGSCPP